MAGQLGNKTRLYKVVRKPTEREKQRYYGPRRRTRYYDHIRYVEQYLGNDTEYHVYVADIEWQEVEDLDDFKRIEARRLANARLDEADAD